MIFADAAYATFGARGDVFTKQGGPIEDSVDALEHAVHDLRRNRQGDHRALQAELHRRVQAATKLLQSERRRPLPRVLLCQEIATLAFMVGVICSALGGVI